MKREIYIQIPEPCHEDWNKMTAVQQGRFCQSCCKEVIDFSTMTDQEVIHFLSKPRGKMCGNFASDQLHRVISETTTPSKKKMWAMAFSFIVTLFISHKATAQRGKLSISNRHKEPVKCETQLRGDTIAMIVPDTLSIEGRITDSTLHHVPYATVTIAGTNISTVADSAGNYSLKHVAPGDFTLLVSSVGYYAKEIRISARQSSVIKNVALDADIFNLPGVTVTAAPVISCSRIQKDIVLEPEIKPLQDVVLINSLEGRMAGGLSVCRTITTNKTIRDTIADIFKPALIRVFPNPAHRGEHVFVQLALPSDYQLRLFNYQSQLILQTSFRIVSKKQAFQLELPSGIASGMYIINVVDTKTKQQYTHKLIIQ